MPMKSITVADAVVLLKQEGVVICPTEAVYGFSCDPDSALAIEALMNLKQRPKDKGLILVASSVEQLIAWIDASVDLSAAGQSWPGPVTWIMPVSTARTNHPVVKDGTIAVRVTDHPVMRALCDAFGGCLVSTSANPSGQPPAKSTDVLYRYFGDQCAVLEGALGGLDRPTRIIDGRSGKILRD